MQGQSRVLLDFPFPEERVFRYRAMQDILHKLVNEPFEAFTQQELAEMADADVSTVSRSVDLLQQMGVVTVDEGRPSRVSIDHDHLQKPDPVLSIPQEEFRRPVRAFLEELRESVDESDELGSIVGVVLFGSVARGTADRGSDIDLLVVFEGKPVYGRRVASEATAEIQDRKFDGDRYEFEVLAETPKSAAQYGSELREIFDEGIVLQRSDEFGDVRAAVYGDDESEGT